MNEPMTIESINSIVGELRLEAETNALCGSPEWTECLNRAAETIIGLHEMVLKLSAELEQSKTETAQRDADLAAILKSPNISRN